MLKTNLTGLCHNIGLVAFFPPLLFTAPVMKASLNTDLVTAVPTNNEKTVHDRHSAPEIDGKLKIYMPAYHIYLNDISATATEFALVSLKVFNHVDSV